MNLKGDDYYGTSPKVLRASAQIPLRGTSDTLNPLCGIMLGFLFDKERCGGLAQCLKNNKNLNKL